MRGRDELRGLLERLPDFAVVHVDGRIIWCNREAARLLGHHDPERLVGTPLRTLVAPGTDAYALHAITDGGARDRRFELILERVTGGVLRVEAAAAEDVVFDGVPSRLVVARDLTERLRLQQQLVAADRLTSVGLLAAGVAHEVNNPLAYVLNNIEIARRELSEPPARSAEALGTALEGVERIRVIVRDLLLLSRGEAGPVRSTDLDRIVDSTLALARVEIERTASLERRIERVPPVLADESSLAQALLNLLVNALEAMHGRPREQNRLVVGAVVVDDGVSLHVTDNGVGIAPEHLPKIFDPFFSTKQAGSGTGLGLSITQQLVAQLGGELRVSSVLGEGTTFEILLRRADG